MLYVSCDVLIHILGMKFSHGCNSFLLSDRTRRGLKRRSMNDRVPIYIRVKKRSKGRIWNAWICVRSIYLYIYICICMYKYIWMWVAKLSVGEREKARYDTSANLSGVCRYHRTGGTMDGRTIRWTNKRVKDEKKQERDGINEWMSEKRGGRSTGKWKKEESKTTMLEEKTKDQEREIVHSYLQRSRYNVTQGYDLYTILLLLYLRDSTF